MKLEAAGAAKSASRARELMYDAVHMKPAGYPALAGKVRELTQQCMLARKRKGEPIAQPAGKRAKTDPEGCNASASSSSGGGKKGGPRPPRGSPKEGRGAGTAAVR